MGHYTGIVWVIIVNCHHTQEFLSQLTLVIKKISGSDWERIRDFCTKKRGSRFGSLSFANSMQNMEINGACCHSSAASAVAASASSHHFFSYNLQNVSHGQYGRTMI